MRKFFAILAFLMVFFSSFSGLNRVSSLSFTLEAIPECGYIQLKWEAVTGADRYYIYRGPGEGMEYDTPLTDFPIEETSYKDVTDLVMNQKYCYIVKAVNQEGREFLNSTEACATFTCLEEIPPIGEDEDCNLVLKYQVGNYYYWRNENQKGPMDVEPVLLNSRVLASARYLAEEVGAVVFWDAATRTVKIITLDGVVIQMQIGNPIMMVNGVQVQIDPNNKAVTPIIYKNRTMLPFRALAYNLGATGPDDIVWLGDIKTAVLTFHDHNCNWICGCYRPYMSPVAAILSYQFYKGCNDAEKMNLNIPATMKDKLHGWLFAEYVKQFPNLKYWCVEVRVDKDGTVIAWRARPDQYPNCCKPKECKWVCGCVKRWSEAPNNHLSITFMPDCNMDSESLTFIVPKTLKDTALGFTLVDYFRQYGNQNYWCMEICIGPDGNLVQWKATPEKYPECCPKISDWLCGCVTSVKPPTAATNLNFLYVNFLLDCNPTSNTVLTYTIDPTLKDLILGLTIQEYIAKYPNQEKWCVEVVTQNNKIIHWKATPEKYPDCCKPEIDCRAVCGCILGVEMLTDTKAIIKFSPECNQNNVISLIMDASLLDTQLQLHITDYLKKFPDQKYWCAIMCIGRDNEVVIWTATPEKYPDCCKPEVDCKEVCGCLLSATLISDMKIVIEFAPDCDFTKTEKLIVDKNMHDSKFNYLFTDYIKRYPNQKYWCVVLCMSENKEVVKWTATPEKYPDCCKPAECKWICGCVRLWTENSSDSDHNFFEITFDPDCDDDGDSFILSVPITAPDSIYGYTFMEYFRKYKDQKYWCLELCLTENNYLVSWKAAPEKYPDCCKPELDCKEVNGYILEVKNIPGTNNTTVVFAPDCDPTKVLNLVMIGNLPDTQYGMTFWTYLEKYPNQKYWCATICLIEDTEIIKWTATPEKYPDCCKQQEDVWICGCIVSVQASSDDTNDNFINVVISLDCDYEDDDNYTVYEMPEDQLDTNYGYTIPEYFDKYPDHKRLCLEFIAKGTRILKWRATPEKYPDCGNPSVPCKEICGCILAVDPIAGTNTTQILFSPDCNLANSITLVMTGNLLDTALHIPIGTYLEKFPNQKYWCAKMCITANNAIIKWTATPEKYPDCCKEEGGRIVAHFPEKCIVGTGVLIYNSAGMTVWIGEPNQNGYIDTGCILKCNEVYKVFPINKTCTFIPPIQEVKVPCCPEKAEIKFDCTCEPLTKYCGCIVRMTIDPDANGNYSVYFKKNCAQGDPVYDLVLLFPSTLLDTELGVNALDYYNSVPGTTPNKYACIEVAVNSAGQAVQWSAFPNRKPCCGGEEGGRLVVYMPAKCIKGTTVYVYDAAGAVVFSGSPNADGIIDTGCKLKCPATYVVLAKNPNCTFKPEKQEVKVPCCPEKAEIKFDCTCESEYGRIKITVPSDCASSTYITIYDAETGSIVLKFTPADYANGIFDTGCKLPCGRSYKIVPNNTKCKLTPESVVVKCPCCPEFAQVTFTINQTESFGRIVCYVPGTCVTGTKIVIADVAGNIVWSGSPNDNGYIDTGCVLKCNTTYQVIPKNVNYTFNPEYKEIKLPCCPEKVEIRFECTQKKGRIVVNIPRDCIKGSTMVYVYDQEPTSAIKPVGAIMMGNDLTFDTECTLICGKAYWVKPVNDQCKFLPEYQKVIPPCCPEYAKVDFKCDCTSTKGRIVVNIPRICLQTSTIVYLFDVEPTSSTKPIGAIMMGDDLTFDTDCTLVCNKAYWLKPQNEACKFFPEVMKVIPPCCPEYASVSFKCECESEKARITISLPTSCIQNTKVLIYEGTSNLVATLIPNDNGIFDTLCTLKCGAYYTIVPKNEKCTFYPASQYIQTKCCPEINNVAFKCECETSNANIIVSVPTNCAANTTVYIYEGEYSANKRAIITLTPDRAGKCQTGCVLKCNTLYTVIPKKADCTFYPASQAVKTSCCPEFNTVTFKCECGPYYVVPISSVSLTTCLPRCTFKKEDLLL